MKELYNLSQEMVHAGQMGIPLLRVERMFRDGLDAYGRSDTIEAKELLGKASETLNWEISRRRRSYQSVIRSASAVEPIAMDGGAVQIWPIMASENGDMEWNAAIKEVLIRPNQKWRPPQENLEKLVYVIHGRGTAVVEGKVQKVFGGDTVCIPPNIINSFETTGLHAPMALLVWETYPDRKADELKGSEQYDRFPQRKVEQKVSEKDARSALGSASSTIEKARSMGIHQLYEVPLCHEIVQKCLQGRDFDSVWVLSHIVVDQVERYISDLRRNRELIAARGVPISNRTYLERQVFHAGTCPAWLLSADLPVEYTQFLSAFEIEAGTRLGPHTHNTEEFYYVLQGRAHTMVADPIGNRYFEKNQPPVEVNSGDLIRIPPNSLHSIFPAGEGYRISCLALIGYTDEKAELNDTDWEMVYKAG